MNAGAGSPRRRPGRIRTEATGTGGSGTALLDVERAGSEGSGFTIRTDVTVIALTSDEAEVVGVDAYGKLFRWERLTGLQLAGPLTLHAERTVWGMVLTADDREVVSAGADGTVGRWDRTTGEPLAERFAAHAGPILGLALTGDGHELLTASRDGTVRRWERTTWSPLGEPLRGHFGAVRAVALTPDQDLIVTAGQDGTVRRWNRESARPLGEPLRGHDGPVQALAVGPDGREFASGGLDGTVRRWGRGADRPLGGPLVAGAPVRCVLLTGDGEITAACANGTLHRWDRTGQRIGAVLPAHTTGIWSMTTTKDESELLSAGWDRRLLRWERVTGVPLRPARTPTRIETVPRLEIQGPTPF
ncbi:WD40 repeat domain-containing protein [Streptomyces sp. NPDC017254]|uniref:WD40 repeat domain-containing protein n=1 Tax=unclassified Streptomyces TaxID=2593676 RepID=UPI00378FE427